MTYSSEPDMRRASETPVKALVVEANRNSVSSVTGA